MARREWAERKAKAGVQFISVLTDGEVHGLVAKLLQAEHARAVRVVGQAKALQLHGLRDTDTNEFLEGYEAACVDILAALTKGRA